MMEISLPWPPRGLWPNHRHHWAAMARAKRSYKAAAWALTKEAGAVPGVNLAMTFCPPDNRRRDLDNMIAAMKAGIDGISSAIGIDDSRFVMTFAIGEVTPKGAVIVTVTP